MEQTLLALHFFQLKQILHRDIKPDNILIYSIEDQSQYEVRIADLGLAVFCPNNQPQYMKCGSPGYLAPELFRSEGYSYKADIFSLGSVFFNIITSCYLFQGESKDAMLRRNIECNTEGALEHIRPRVSPQGLHLLASMIQKDPANRPTAKEALNFEWFQCDKTILTNLLMINKFLCAKVFEDIEQHLLNLQNHYY